MIHFRLLTNTNSSSKLPGIEQITIWNRMELATSLQILMTELWIGKVPGSDRIDLRTIQLEQNKMTKNSKDTYILRVHA